MKFFDKEIVLLYVQLFCLIGFIILMVFISNNDEKNCLEKGGVVYKPYTFGLQTGCIYGGKK